MPSAVGACLLCGANRPGDNPPAIPRRAKVVTTRSVLGTLSDTVKNCSFGGCLNTARINSKYCSRECSNKNARKRYKEKKSN